jgi:hypothetical protein
VRFIWGARQRLTTVSVCPRRPSWHGRRTCPRLLPCALVRRTAKIYLCCAPVFRRTTKTSSSCVYLSRAAGPRRTTKSGLCLTPDRKRSAKEMVHGKGRLSGSGSGDSEKVQSLVGPWWAVVWPPILGWQSHNVCAPLYSQWAAGMPQLQRTITERDARAGPSGYGGRVCAGGVRKIFVFGKTLSKLWFFVLHNHSTLSTFKNIWRVGPTWGVRRVRFEWEKFSIVFAPYSIDRLVTCPRGTRGALYNLH